MFTPKLQPVTREVSGAVRLAERELRFSVSRDGEHVERLVERRSAVGQLRISTARLRILDA